MQCLESFDVNKCIIIAVTDARLNLQADNVEYLVTVKDDDADELEMTVYVSQTKLSHQTLQSNVFETFFKSKGNNISTNHQLKLYLKQQLLQSQPFNPDTQVKIELINDVEIFTIDKLKQLSYFNAMFSDRWMNNRNKNEIIKPFVNNNENDGNHIQPIFDCKDLKLLLTRLSIANGT